MSSASLRSPPLRPPRMKKDESFLGKLGGTLARKKKAREVSDLQEEGRHAIDSPMSPASVDVHPEDTVLEENEERTMIDPTSKDDPKFKELVKVLIDWVNDVLVEERIIVKQLEEDLYDGQVLQKLLEKLACCKLNVAEVTQSEVGQRQKLQTVLEAVHSLLRPHGWALQWTVDSIHGKNLVAILHLLVALAMHFRAPIRLPEHVSVQVVVVRKREGLLHSSHITEELTTTTEMMMGRFERDAFDTLFDHAPDKLSVVKKSLITFVNKHLNKLNLEVTELETQVHNVAFAFELMLDGGLKTPKARPEDVVNLDLKSTLRVLYNLFTKYKNLE
ncbi:beta-parvin isoform X3 [Prionailurus bengalensis]|uniref:beta-parvin isoform X3 n=1 Tax=Prionailurus bengalensis TaxID=37029 RepID=UPI001CA9B811|nr:beta-parvin isoform X3 [Prionailurus bengalensis]